MPEFATSDGIKIHYEVDGLEDGPALIFSNSLGANLHMWDGQMAEATGRGFRAIRYDQRGHGESSAPKGPYTLERLGRDLIELTDELEIERPFLCGLSMGGMTGMWVAINEPRRFSRIALCNTASWMPTPDIWDTRIADVTKGGMAAVVDATEARWFTEGFRNESRKEVERIRKMVLETDPAGYSGCCAAIRDMDLRDQLGLIEVPVHVFIGAHDPATTPERGQILVERIPGAQKTVLDAAHLSNVEQPDDFNRAVFGFLAVGHA
jgi:3-oxoadipate enol-lactonase